jgi:NIMA (never in mitosis gene a)-related kinase 1/4/5
LLTHFSVAGEGSFSEVYLVLRKSDSQVYAMKKVKLQKLSSKEKENALNEVRILASINHPNVIGYKEAFFESTTDCLCIIMENADGGDMLQLINTKKKSR